MVEPTMKGTLVPHEDRVIVRKIKEDKTPGGVILPDGFKNQARGIVVAVGPGAASFKKDDCVLFVRSGVKIHWDGDELVVLRQGEIIAQVK